jgi:hypothetical protein
MLLIIVGVLIFLLTISYLEKIRFTYKGIDNSRLSYNFELTILFVSIIISVVYFKLEDMSFSSIKKLLVKGIYSK